MRFDRETTLQIALLLMLIAAILAAIMSIWYFP